LGPNAKPSGALETLDTMRILIVEDEAKIAEDMANSLVMAGFAADICGDGEEAWFLGDTEDFDAVILDLGLPKLDGLTVLKRWREGGRNMPVIVLTARDGWTARVEGINIGADDYLNKPFKMEELIARVRAVLRRTHGHAGPVLKAGTMTLDTSQMRISVDGTAVPLTPLEYRLISYLLHHKGRIVPGGELRDHVYGSDDAREANAVEAIIVRLRRKLGPGSIETRRGLGYCIRDGGG
jgi:two-component system, OmpR family, response regulator